MENLASLVYNLKTYDIVVLVITLLFLVRGVWVGALRQITVFLALYIGYIVASQYHQQIFPILEKVSSNPKVIFLTSYVLLFLVTYLVVLLLGKLLKMVVDLSLAGWFDRLLGGVIGILKAAIIVVLLHMLLGTVLAPENTMLRECTICPYLNTVSSFTRNIIRDPEARKALLQKAPAIGVDRVKEYLDNVSTSSTSTGNTTATTSEQVKKENE